MNRRSRFRRNFFSLARSNLLAQLLLLAALPVLTRFYSPAEFGVLAVFTSLLVTAESFCVWRFNQAMPNARSLGGAASLMVSGAAVLLLVASLIAVGEFVVPALFESFESYRKLGALAIFLPVAVLLTGLRLLLQAWFVRRSEMEVVSTARICYAVGYLSMCFVMVGLGKETSGLVVATTAAIGIACAFLLKGAGGVLYRVLRRVSPRRLGIMTRAALPFASKATLVGFVNFFSLSLPVLLLSQLYDAASLGLYALLFSMVIVPARTFTAALSLSFWARAAELARAGRYVSLSRLYFRVTGVMALGAALVVVVCALSPLYLVAILGDDWVGADPVLIRMVPLIVGIIVFSPTNHLVVMNLQSLQLIADGLRIALLFTAFWLAGERDWSFDTAVLAMSLSSLAGHVALFACHPLAYRLRARGAAARSGEGGDRFR